jgi:myosin-15
MEVLDSDVHLSLPDWQPVHSERHLVKVVGGVAGRPDSERHHLPHDIDSHAFTKFTNIYFKVSLFRLVTDEYQNLRVF